MSRPEKRGLIYEEPRLYDLAFSFRDIPEECDGLLALARAHGVERPKRVLEIACGPGHHLREFAKRGIGAVGVDLNASMLGYAKRLMLVDGVSVDLRRADMRSFRLAKRVDIAMCLFDSFAHCTSDEDGIAALRATGAAVRRGGLFVLELTHPADYFDPSHGRTLGRWTQRHPGVVVDARYDTSARDAVAETYRATLTIDAKYADGRRPRKIVGKQLHRMWLRGSVSNIAARSGAFDVVGWYGDLDVGVPFTMKMDSWRMVVVMRRR
ncbi:MAG TPA: class I SAM-dependent methyltransferase [Candidatus Eremiobacteraceae bacterium]|nr:class I SAM-dependent methyltransferase [Candidatus Eremiobacteraceae bacterium]